MLFDPFTAPVAGWKAFLTSSASTKGNYDTLPYKSALREVVEGVVVSSVDIALRAKIATNAVEAVLAEWDSIVAIQNATGRLDPNSHPLTFVPYLALVDGRMNEELAKIVQRLWHEFPGEKSYVDRHVQRLIEGLRTALPEDQRFLEMLYKEHFEKYSFLALAIMLERGEYVAASKLFEANASRYGGFDPGTFDDLIRSGLPASVGRIWLDQSVNAKKGYEGHYDSALERWAELEKK